MCRGRLKEGWTLGDVVDDVRVLNVDEEDVRGEKVEATASEMQCDGEEESMASVEGLKAAPMAEPAEAVS